MEDQDKADRPLNPRQHHPHEEARETVNQVDEPAGQTRIRNPHKPGIETRLRHTRCTTVL